MVNEKKMGRPKREKSPFNDIFRELTKGETQNETAAKIGVARQNISKWISGETAPDIITLGKIASAYNVSTDYLLGRSKSKDTEQTEKKAVCDYLGLSEDVIGYIQETNNFWRCKIDNEAYLEKLFSTKTFREILNELIHIEHYVYELRQHAQNIAKKMARDEKYNDILGEILLTGTWSNLPHIKSDIMYLTSHLIAEIESNINKSLDAKGLKALEEIDKYYNERVSAFRGNDKKDGEMNG